MNYIEPSYELDVSLLDLTICKYSTFFLVRFYYAKSMWNNKHDYICEYFDAPQMVYVLYTEVCT